MIVVDGVGFRLREAIGATPTRLRSNRRSDLPHAYDAERPDRPRWFQGHRGRATLREAGVIIHDATQSCDGDCGAGAVAISHHTDSSVTDVADLPIVYRFWRSDRPRRRRHDSPMCAPMNGGCPARAMPRCPASGCAKRSTTRSSNYQGLCTSTRSLSTSSDAVNSGRLRCSARTSADHESRASTASSPARASVSATIVRTGNHSSTVDNAAALASVATCQDRSQLGSCRHGPRDELRGSVRWSRQTSRGPGSPHPTAQRPRGSPTPQAPRRRRKRRYAVSMSRKRRRIASKSARLMGSQLRANSAGERRDAIRVNWSRKYCCTDSPAAAACSRSRFPTSSSRPFTFKSMATIIPIWYHICRPSITSGCRHPCGNGPWDRVLGFVVGDAQVDAGQPQPRHQTRVGEAVRCASSGHPVPRGGSAPAGTGCPHRRHGAAQDQDRGVRRRLLPAVLQLGRRPIRPLTRHPAAGTEHELPRTGTSVLIEACSRAVGQQSILRVSSRKV